MILIDNVLIALGVLYATLNIMYVLTIIFLDLGDRLESNEVSIMRENNLLTYLLFAPGKIFITAWLMLLLLLGSVSCLAILTIYGIFSSYKNKF